eukprot:1141673-Pelagomonas_calceolata.AAC.1
MHACGSHTDFSQLPDITDDITSMPIPKGQQTVGCNPSGANSPDITTFACGKVWQVGQVWQGVWQVGQVWQGVWQVGQVWQGVWQVRQVWQGVWQVGKVWQGAWQVGKVWQLPRTKTSKLVSCLCSSEHTRQLANSTLLDRETSTVCTQMCQHNAQSSATTKHNHPPPGAETSSTA